MRIGFCLFTALACCLNPNSGFFSQVYTIEKQDRSIQWKIDYPLALQEAEQENKPLFILFEGSDWCMTCKELKEDVLNQPAFIQQVADKFIFLNIDFPMKQQLPKEVLEQNKKLKDQFSVQRFPTVVLITSNGLIIDRVGYVPGSGVGYAQTLLNSLNENQKGM